MHLPALVLLLFIAVASLFSPLCSALPLDVASSSAGSARWTHANSPSALHSLPLSQPSVDLQPLVPLDNTTPPSAAEETASAPSLSSRKTDGYVAMRLEPERRYARQARYFESPKDRLERRGREMHLLEYLA